MRYFLLLLALALVSCDRTPAVSKPLGLPGYMTFHISAPSLGELRKISRHVEPLAVAVLDDEDKPAWFGCKGKICVLRRAHALEEIQRDGDRWLAPDGTGSIVVWGAGDVENFGPVLGEWRIRPTFEPKEGWSGFINPPTLLQHWKPKNERARELIDRVSAQAGLVFFDLKVSDTAIDLDLRPIFNAGEPRFVPYLGEPKADPPPIVGLTDAGMLGLLRLSADAKMVWALVRSTLVAEQRGELDAFVEQLENEVHISLEKDVIQNLDGHAFVVAYGLAPGEHSLADWLTLAATREALVIGVVDRAPIRRALDAWTQLSKGRLQVQSTKSNQQEWAWFEDGVIQWTAMLGPNSLIVVDGRVPLEAARRWEVAPATLAPNLAERGVGGLLEQRDRSGIYIDVAALRPMLGKAFEGFIPELKSVTVAVDPDSSGEHVLVRLTRSSER